MSGEEMRVNLVVAMCNNRGIGVKGKLPWHLKKDMHFFKTVTSETTDTNKQNVVIMGKKTWLSIPEKHRPLSNRINVILSRELKDPEEGSYLAGSFKDALQLVSSEPLKDKIESVFVIGGASVYKEAIETCDCRRLYLTRVMADIECDTFLPPFEEKFRKIDNPPVVPEGTFTEEGIDFKFETYEEIN